MELTTRLTVIVPSREKTNKQTIKQTKPEEKIH